MMDFVVLFCFFVSLFTDVSLILLSCTVSLFLLLLLFYRHVTHSALQYTLTVPFFFFFFFFFYRDVTRSAGLYNITLFFFFFFFFFLSFFFTDMSRTVLGSTISLLLLFFFSSCFFLQTCHAQCWALQSHCSCVFFLPSFSQTCHAQCWAAASRQPQ